MFYKVDNSVEKHCLPPLEELCLEPLHGRMKNWRNEIHGAVMSKIKQNFTSAPLLLLPDPPKKFIIHVDACINRRRGFGSTLNHIKSKTTTLRST